MAQVFHVVLFLLLLAPTGSLHAAGKGQAVRKLSEGVGIQRFDRVLPKIGVSSQSLSPIQLARFSEVIASPDRALQELEALTDLARPVDWGPLHEAALFGLKLDRPISQRGALFAGLVNRAENQDMTPYFMDLARVLPREAMVRAERSPFEEIIATMVFHAVRLEPSKQSLPMAKYIGLIEDGLEVLGHHHPHPAGGLSPQASGIYQLLKRPQPLLLERGPALSAMDHFHSLIRAELSPELLDQVNFLDHPQVVLRWFEAHKAKEIFEPIPGFDGVFDATTALLGQISKGAEISLLESFIQASQHDSQLAEAFELSVRAFEEMNGALDSLDRLHISFWANRSP